LIVPLLLPEDYQKLAERAIEFEEDEAQRFLVFKNVSLPAGVYTAERADVLVMIPANYNESGNDMLWTKPRLRKADGELIPNTSDPGPNGDNRTYKGEEYCRWSRHWMDNMASKWKPGVDDVISIYRRIEWALHNPTKNGT
jgi:hypothetical protein